MDPFAPVSGLPGRHLDASQVVRAILTPTAPPEEAWSKDGAFPPGCAPGVDGEDRVFIGTLDGRLLAVDGTSGAPLWEKKTGILGGSPIVDRAGHVLAAPVGGNLVSLDAKTGTEIWSRGIPSANFVETPQVGREAIILRSQQGCLYGLDPDSGRVRWSHPCDPPVAPAPRAGRNGVVCVPFGRENRLLGLDEKDGHELWRSEFDGPPRSMTQGDDGAVYVFWEKREKEGPVPRWTPMIRALDGDTGTPMWDRPVEPTLGWVELRLGDVVDGCVLATAKDGRIFGVGAEDGAVRWTRQGGYGELSVSPPVVGPDRQLYVVEAGTGVHLFDPATGGFAGDFLGCGASTVSGPSVGPTGAVYVADDAGAIHAIRQQRLTSEQLVEQVEAASPAPPSRGIQVENGWVVVDGIRVPRKSG